MSASGAADDLPRGLRELGFAPTAEQLEQLRTLARELERWAQRMNLTGHRSAAAIERHLILGAAALAAHIPALPELADIGSGAGFPGLPIAVLRPGIRVTLVEPRERRHHFQRAAVRALGLRNVEPLLGRAESPDLARPHAAAVAQAVAESSRALRWIEPWVGPAGLALLPAGAGAPAPKSENSFVFEHLDYRLPLGGPPRRLWVGRRGADVPRGTSPVARGT